MALLIGINTALLSLSVTESNSKMVNKKHVNLVAIYKTAPSMIIFDIKTTALGKIYFYNFEKKLRSKQEKVLHPLKSLLEERHQNFAVAVCTFHYGNP